MEILDVRWCIHLPILTTKRAVCYVYVTSHGHLSNQTEVQTAISGVIICYIPLPKTHIKVHIQDPNPRYYATKKRHLQKQMQVNSKQYIPTQWFWAFSSICQHENPTPPMFFFHNKRTLQKTTHSPGNESVPPTPPHDFGYNKQSYPHLQMLKCLSLRGVGLSGFCPNGPTSSGHKVYPLVN